MAASEQRRLQQLLTSAEEPSQLLRHMQQLLGDSAVCNPDNKFLRELFLQRLPNNVRMVLASASDMSLEDLAQLADRIIGGSYTYSLRSSHLPTGIWGGTASCRDCPRPCLSAAALHPMPLVPFTLHRDGSQHLQPASSRLFFVTDHSSGLRFLMDTVAEVSVLPVSWLSRSTSPAGPTLQAIKHSTIATFGSTSWTINLGLLGLRQTSLSQKLSIPYLVQISCTTSAYSWMWARGVSLTPLPMSKSVAPPGQLRGSLTHPMCSGVSCVRFTITYICVTLTKSVYCMCMVLTGFIWFLYKADLCKLKWVCAWSNLAEL